MTAQPHARQTTGNDPMQRAQEVRLARYAELLEQKFYDFSGGGCYSMPDIARHVMALADAEVLAAITVAKSEMAQCVAERDQARAEVAALRLTVDLEVENLLTRAWEDGNCTGLDGWIGEDRGEQPDEHALYVRGRHVTAALERLRDALAAEPTPPAAPHAEDGALDCCGHVHTPEGCTGPPTPSDVWAGVSPSVCDCDTPAPVADPSGTGETRRIEETCCGKCPGGTCYVDQVTGA